jgi:V8-like Glu-specific endopeptidase
MDFFDQLRSYIADDDCVAALDGLEGYIKGRTAGQERVDNRLRGWLREIYLHRATLVRERRRQRLGITDISRDAVHNRVPLAVLELIDDVEKISEGAPRPLSPGFLEPRTPEAGLERVWGLNTLKSLSWLRQGLACADAVCRIETQTAYGTGFLANSGWVFTNHHVIGSAQAAAGARFEFGFQENNDGSLTQPATYRVDPATYVGNPTLDCAVVRISVDSGSSEPSTRWGKVRIQTSPQLEVGQHVVIIQHPQGGPKRICMTDNQIVNIFEHRLQYMTDTMPGSSGSPVFADDWSVVAIHHAGGNLQKNSRGDRMFANEGVLFSFIAQYEGFRNIIGQAAS